MQEFFRIVENPRVCSYLPQKTASLEVRAIGRMNEEEYGVLLARGYRRFGWQVFRPACPGCRDCRSLRVLVQQFTPTTRDRRILRRNTKIRAELYPLFVTREHVDLYNEYHRFMHRTRGWPLQQTTVSSYTDSFLSGAANVGRQWMYFQGDRLVGVALMDEAPDAVSLVYCFYDPGWRADSPGVFSILNQIEYAKSRSLQYAYLGYWIEQCSSMNYKHRFRPQEVLQLYPADGVDPVWQQCPALISC